ncbi:hypothetical protein BH10ACI3_BH10ACI3_28510 [soil metagenome]
MNPFLRFAAIAVVVFSIGLTGAFAQKAKPKAPVSKTPDFSIAELKVMAYSSSTGDLQDAIPDEGEPMSFFNDLDTSLFVWVFVKGGKGTFEAGRMANIVVTVGKKVVLTRNVQVGIPNEDGLYIVPAFVYGPLCSNVNITAKLTGQKSSSSRTVSVPFNCGE